MNGLSGFREDSEESLRTRSTSTTHGGLRSKILLIHEKSNHILETTISKAILVFHTED